ncbi:hypothetical protein ACP4OV_023887 [Aristida adscensionis]
MAQTDAECSTHHVVIDVVDADGDGDGEPSCCAVCTEPLEWVAVGRCGHADVCAGCAARLRFLQRNRRCCICRTRCPTVLVIRAGDAARRPQAFSRRRPASGRHGPVDAGHWYLAGMRAYFDDRRQYKAMRKACRELARSEAAAAEARVAVDLGMASLLEEEEEVDDDNMYLDALDVLPAEWPCVGWFMIYLSAIVMMIAVFQLCLGMAEQYYERVIIVVVFGFPFVEVTQFAISTWQRYKTPSTSVQLIDAET